MQALQTLSAHGQLIDNEKVYLAEVVLKSTVLCFDFGEQRIGVAVGEHLLANANPLTTIDNESNDIRFTIISQLVQEWQPKLLVVGLPLSLDGTETNVSQLCKKFARRSKRSSVGVSRHKTKTAPFFRRPSANLIPLHKRLLTCR